MHQHPVAGAGQRPDFLGHERHHRMRHGDGLLDHPAHGGAGFLGVLAVEQGLGELDIPVAELAPDKAVKPLRRLVEAIARQRVVQRDPRPRGLADDPAVHGVGGLRLACGRGEHPVHFRKPHRVPDLGDEIAVRLDMLRAQLGVAAHRGHAGQGKAQRVGAIGVDQLQRVDDVALGLGHLGAFFVAHQPVDIDGAEGHLAHHRQLHHHHPRHPEEDDVEAGDQRVGRKIFPQLFGILGPAQRPDRPQTRGKPRIQHIRIAPDRIDQPGRVLRQVIVGQRLREGIHRRLAVGDLDHAADLQRMRQPGDIGAEGLDQILEMGGGVMQIARPHQLVVIEQPQQLDRAQRVVALVVGEAVGGQVQPVPHGDLVAPPQLARDGPRLDVFQPVEIHLFMLFRQDAGAAVAHGVDGGLHDGGGVDEPLVGQHRLDHHARAVAKGLHDLLALDIGVAVGVGDRQPLGVDRGDHAGAGLQPVQPAQILGDEVDRGHVAHIHPGRGAGRDGGGIGIRQPVAAHPRPPVHQRIQRDAIAQRHAIVVEVMRPGDLDRARAEIGVGVIVGDDRDQPAMRLRPHRNLAQLADDGGIAGVTRMHRHRAVAQHGFGAGGGDRDIVPGLAQGHVAVGVAFHVFIGLAPGQRVFEMPHLAVDLAAFDLEVRNRGLEMRVPVDQPLAAIDQPLVVHVDKDPDHRVVEIALFARGRAGGARHGEGIARPVEAGAQPLELADNGAARLRLPVPDAAQELLAPHLGAGGVGGVFRQLAFDHHLGGDAGVVLPGLPQHVKAAHPVPAGQDILQRVVQRVADMQAAGDVRRRDHHGKRGLPRPGVGTGGKGAAILPRCRDAGLGGGGVEGLFHAHASGPLAWSPQ